MPLGRRTRGPGTSEWILTGDFERDYDLFTNWLLLGVPGPPCLLPAVPYLTREVQPRQAESGISACRPQPMCCGRGAEAPEGKQCWLRGRCDRRPGRPLGPRSSPAEFERLGGDVRRDTELPPLELGGRGA